MRNNYSAGVRVALDKFGALGNDEPTTVPQAALTGAAAASPFAGLIGLNKPVHDPFRGANVNEFTSVSDLARVAQPGDVILTSKPDGSVWKTFLTPATGSEFYHAQPVVGRRGGYGTTTSAGYHGHPSWRRTSGKDILAQVETIPQYIASDKATDVMLMRPKTPLTPEQQKAYSQRSILESKRPYSSREAVELWLRDLFVPKLGDPKTQTGRGGRVVCDGHVCSTLPARMHEEITGRKVVPHSAQGKILPYEYLHSSEFEPVGAYLGGKYKTTPGIRRALPYITRGGIGLGLGAGAYGLYENPELLAAPVGAAAGGYATHKTMSSPMGQLMMKRMNLPNVANFADDLGAMDNFLRNKRFWKGVGLYAPMSALGGATAYGLARNVFKPKREAAV